MPVKRQKWIISTVVALSAVILYYFITLILTPKVASQNDPRLPISYSVEIKRIERVGNNLLVSGSFQSNRGAEIERAEIRFRHRGEQVFRSTSMKQVNRGAYWVGELPALGISEVMEWYITIFDTEGTTANIPSNAPRNPLFTTKWERQINPSILASKFMFILGALIFLFHSLYYASLILFGRMGDLAQNATTNKAHQSLRWGWLSFFLGAVPISMYISAVTSGIQHAWGGWPVGNSFTDTASELLLIYFGSIILLRVDQFYFTPSVRKTGRISNKLMAWLILIGFLVTMLLAITPLIFSLRRQL